MVRFLSPEWFDAVAARRLSGHPEVDLELEQRITGGPAGDVRYRVGLHGGRLTVTPIADGDGPADLVLTMPYATAVALATGRSDATEAFLDGLVRVSGDLGRLHAAGPALAGLGAALDALGLDVEY